MPELYLITPPIHRASDISARLGELTRALPVAVVRLRLLPGHDGPSLVAALREGMQNRDIALLIEDDIDFALKAGTDGVHLTTPLRAAEARRQLGAEARIGANCFASRHAAMEAGEAGVDYVCFTPVEAPEALACLQWWAEMSDVPTVAEGAFDEALARQVTAAGADFIAVEMAALDDGIPAWLAELAD